MELDRMLKALGEPMRLKIYQSLLERKHCVRSLSKKFGISESAISQHIKVMKDAELVFGGNIGYDCSILCCYLSNFHVSGQLLGTGHHRQCF